MSTVRLVLLWLVTSMLAEGRQESASEYVSRGMQRFQLNKIAESIRDFDRAVEIEPRIAPRLWQRGISLYYAGQYEKGRQQFKSHQRVNPHDVENAAWHFLCVARIDGVQAAERAILTIDTRRDTRVPMSQVYAFYSGRGSEEAVIRAAERDGTERARMYAHLYLGLYYEVVGEADRAQSHMRKAAAARLQDHYMHDVARVHLLQRKWKP